MSTTVGDSVPYGLVTVVGASGPLFEERLRLRGRGWIWLPPVLVITFLAIAPVIVPVALLAWFVNVARFWRTTVRIDADNVWVGRRSVRLVALDLTTLGRAQNTWPWRTFSNRWLGGNPIWTSDSVGVRGFDGGKPYWVSVGTNRRDELVTVLEGAVLAARERTPNPVLVSATSTAPPGWHPDPWDPVSRRRAASTVDAGGGAPRGADQSRRLRWWDGTQWTGWTHPPTSGPSTSGRAAS